ncbi:hypothetical protein AM571_CH02893 [Rhizobium etli 8C-3]|uniref:Uncharacterized protein n=1 Tax=Rhizobium etli 8C-3 TaxID=538025 RepID=A0A1L5P6E1_RHIET|nr:hypothetical protein AM571_CH02893 [Rhizobium etli 8C-3]
MLVVAGPDGMAAGMVAEKTPSRCHALCREPAAAQACHQSGHAYVGSGVPAHPDRLPLPAPSHSQSPSGGGAAVTGALALILFGSDGYGKMQVQVMAARLIVSAAAPFALAYLIISLGVGGFAGNDIGGSRPCRARAGGHRAARQKRIGLGSGRGGRAIDRTG